LRAGFFLFVLPEAICLPGSLFDDGSGIRVKSSTDHVPIDAPAADAASEKQGHAIPHAEPHAMEHGLCVLEANAD
jgi:hypothetical protein